MSDTKIVTGKFSRTLKTTAIATKSGIKHLGYLGAKQFSSTPDQLLQNHEEEIGKVLFKGLSQMRGTALKASQLLSLEADLLPEGIRNELSKSCYQVPPINKALVRKIFIQEFGQEASKLYQEFSGSAFAAASLGQVHKGKLPSGEEVAIKVQYPGVRESIDSDLKILSFVLSSLSLTTNYLPRKDVISTTLDEIEICLKDEVDYQKEAKNTQWFKENLNVINIRIPEVYDDYTSSRILTTEFLSGHHIDEWLATNPTQRQRNFAGQTIFNAFLYSAFELKALHADPHLGNYLFLDSGEVALLDFGCVKYLSDSFPTDIASLINAILREDQQSVFTSYKALDLFSEELSYDDYKESLYPVLSPMQEWIASPYQSKIFDFSKLTSPITIEPNKHQQAVKYLHGLQRDQMYFDRSYFGIYQLLKKMGAVVSTDNPWLGRSNVSFH